MYDSYNLLDNQNIFDFTRNEEVLLNLKLKGMNYTKFHVDDCFVKFVHDCL